MAFSGAWRNQYMVAEPAPLGKADVQRHIRTDDPVVRDDGPQVNGVAPVITREQQLAQDTAIDPRERTGHNAGGIRGDHDAQDGSALPRKPPEWVNYQHTVFGGDHIEQPVKGSVGAANGGLRGDNSNPWSNPDGFALGKEYTPVQPLRPVWSGRMRAMLRPYTEQTMTDGTQAQPAPDPKTQGLPIRTSWFDLTQRVTQGHGTSKPTQRHIPRPNEGDVNDNQAFPMPQTADPASAWVM